MFFTTFFTTFFSMLVTTFLDMFHDVFTHLMVLHATLVRKFPVWPNLTPKSFRPSDRPKRFCPSIRLKIFLPSICGKLVSPFMKGKATEGGRENLSNLLQWKTVPNGVTSENFRPKFCSVHPSRQEERFVLHPSVNPIRRFPFFTLGLTFT